MENPINYPELLKHYTKKTGCDAECWADARQTLIYLVCLLALGWELTKNVKLANMPDYNIETLCRALREKYTIFFVDENLKYRFYQEDREILQHALEIMLAIVESQIALIQIHIAEKNTKTGIFKTFD